jgi:hypothetical protein
MELSTDHLRREAADSEIEHRQSISRMREAIKRVFDRDRGVSARAKSDFALGGLDRRRFLQIGGLTIATAAVVAACSGDDDNGSSGDASTTTSASGESNDVVILRTATSIEALAVAAYQTAVDSGLVTTMAIADAAVLFQSQHREHLELFAGATEQAGGEPFTDPNPAILEQLQPTIDALSDELGVVQLAYNLEVAAAETYQSTVGVFTDPTLNQASMSVGGTEARHAAVLGGVLTQLGTATTIPPAAFQVTADAVPVGTGV